MILVLIPSIPGDCQIPGFTDHFTAESFSFGVEREVAESAKSGTSDLNIGVGELQECTISKSMDITSAGLARKAISGSSVGTAEIKFVEALTVGGVTYNCVYLYFKLDNAFVKSWSISGDADDRPTEDVALWYNKIGFVYFATKDGATWDPGRQCCWDHVKSAPWADAAMPSAVTKEAT